MSWFGEDTDRHEIAHAGQNALGSLICPRGPTCAAPAVLTTLAALSFGKINGMLGAQQRARSRRNHGKTTIQAHHGTQLNLCGGHIPRCIELRARLLKRRDLRAGCTQVSKARNMFQNVSHAYASVPSLTPCFSRCCA